MKLAVISELLKISRDLPIAIDRSRICFAVSHDEWEEIREYCLEKDGRFYGRIANIPLAEFPEIPPKLWFEEVPHK